MYLGTPARVLYQAKTFATNIPNIYAKVISPQGTILGPFFLMPYLDNDFSGIYYFDYYSNVFDFEGVYSGVVISPNENVKTFFHIELLQRPTAIARGVDILSQNLIGRLVDNSVLTGKLESENELKASLTEDETFKGQIEEDDYE